VYSADAVDAADAADESGPLLKLVLLAVLRESERSGQTQAPLPEQPPGVGLYDPPPADRTDYCSLYLDDGLTLVFATQCARSSAGFLSVDWVAGALRYQADRKFARLDGSLSTLELTEIATEDANFLLPQFPSSGS